MRNLLNTKDQIVAIALGLVIAGTAFGSAAATETSEKVLDQYSLVEIADEVIFMEDISNEIKVYNKNDQLVFEGTANNSNEQAQVLMRISDFLLEVDGVKYYRTYAK